MFVEYNVGLKTLLQQGISEPVFHCVRIKKYLKTATCDFQQCCILISVDSDEPMQPPFKLRNSKLCSVSSLTLKEYSSD